MNKYYIVAGPDGKIEAIYNEAMPHLKTVEVEVENELIEKPHEFRYINGQLTKITLDFAKEIKELKLLEFRIWRSDKLAKYDLLRVNILNGDYDPKTNLTYSPITEEERLWRVEILNFTNYITEDTVPSDYPQPSERLK